MCEYANTYTRKRVNTHMCFRHIRRDTIFTEFRGLRRCLIESGMTTTRMVGYDDRGKLHDGRALTNIGKAQEPIDS